jgi:SpoIIAA-like
MIDYLPSLPDRVLGFRVYGRITRDDFRELGPVLRTAAETGEVRIVEVIGPEFEGLEPAAVLEDLKVGLEFLIGHRSALKRLAIVTDTE